MNNQEAIERANKLAEEGRYTEAIVLFNQAIACFPDNAQLWARNGWCQYQLHEYGAAIESFSKAILLHPQAPTTLYFRAQSYEHIGNLNQALADYWASVNLQPAADAYIAIGLILKFRGDVGAAKDAWNKALRLSPSNPVIKELLGTARKCNDTQGRDILL